MRLLIPITWKFWQRPRKKSKTITNQISVEALSRTHVKLKEFQGGQDHGNKSVSVEAASVQITQVNIELTMTMKELPKVDGLVKRSQNTAETDRYQFDFSDPISFKITDKWTGRSTTVWGDPHVDTNDQDGNSNGEFSDLTGSDSQTTMMLMDGTRVTFTAKDRGVIEAVDIFKGSQHLRGLGGATPNLTAENMLFTGNVDTSSSSTIPMGDVVHAGGDGNDWFTADGKMIWGQTTGPVVTTRPAYQVELQYCQEIIQQSAAAVRIVSASA